jgi:uncharacterized protein
MRIAISGASGLIGRELCRKFTLAGHSLTRLVRTQSAATAPGSIVQWDPAQGVIDAAGLEGHDAVINLAGANLAQRRWTPAVKQELLDSRVNSTRLLAQTLAGLKQPPRVFISASAVGYYGDRPADEELGEDAAAGGDFVAWMAQRWEEAAQPAVDAGLRVVLARLGVALSTQDGALKRMLPAFCAGLGGRLGHGRQMLSWLALPDVHPIMLHLVQCEGCSGPVNCTAPQAVSNAEFTRELGRALHRPALLAVPAAALEAMLGEMAYMLLTGQRAVPRRLLDTGYVFAYPQLAGALSELLSSRA